MIEQGSLLLLGGDHGSHLVALAEGAAVLAETSAGPLDGALLLGGDASAEGFADAALVGSESGDLENDLADIADAGGATASAVALVLLEGVGVRLGLGDDEAVVQANEQSSLLLHLLISLK